MMEKINIDQPDQNVRRGISAKAFLIALVIIAAGLLLLLKNLGLIDREVIRIAFSWPAIIIAIGVINLNGKNAWFGLLLILFGGFFLLADIYNWPFDIGKIFWPLLLIMAGVAIIIFTTTNRTVRKTQVSGKDENFIEEIAIFGGGERLVNSQAFQGGGVISIFGGSKIDFRPSKLAEGVHELSMINLFGGSAIMVPPDWNIKTEVVSIFGGFADKRFHSEVDTSKTLIIKGIAIFGGGEIKN